MNLLNPAFFSLKFYHHWLPPGGGDGMVSNNLPGFLFQPGRFCLIKLISYSGSVTTAWWRRLGGFTLRNARKQTKAEQGRHISFLYLTFCLILRLRSAQVKR
jgi:hypothetical protein